CRHRLSEAATAGHAQAAGRRNAAGSRQAMNIRALVTAGFLVAAALPATAGAATVKELPVPKGEMVWYAEDHSLPMIAMVASFPAGSAYDPRGKDGLAAFSASLLDEGSGNLNSKQFQEALANRAIQLS